jgi:hypothetical protein
MRLSSTIVRWTLAPVAAAGAFGLGVIVGTALRLAISLASGETDVSGGPDAMTLFLEMLFAVTGWFWAGAAIAPASHRRLAFVLFSTPALLFALGFLVLFAAGQVEPSRVPLGLGAVAGCGGIIILGVVWRHRARAAKRRKTLEEIAHIFSDEGDPVAQKR